MGELVPFFTSLGQVYGDGDSLVEARTRFRDLESLFLKLYGTQPELYARAPGRVNLIGEHIDYEGYSVLPMALRQDVVVAIRKQSFGSELKLRVANSDPSAFPAASFMVDPSQAVNLSKHHWANYFLCGYKGVYEHLELKGLEPGGLVGLDVVVDGIVPVGAGVSSSSALVCSSALAVMAVLGLRFSKLEVAEFACLCECHIGTQSGGMDQAISLMAKAGVAQLIDFNPIRAWDVLLPFKAAFVIANSLTVSTKAESAVTRYNCRVVECRLAAMVLALKLGLPAEELRNIHTLRDIQDLCLDYGKSHGYESLQLVVEAILGAEPYTLHEIQDTLHLDLNEVFKKSTSSLKVLAAVSKFHLLDRAKHVFSEAKRVYDFRDVVSSSATEEMKLAKLGELMTESHVSCSQLYDCSCEELEELVKECKLSGAAGARLTGAGWGGCVVALLESSSVSSFIEALRKRFYQSKIDGGLIEEKDMGKYVFASKPAGGAAILRL